jgi:hypothetical protein
MGRRRWCGRFPGRAGTITYAAVPGDAASRQGRKPSCNSSLSGAIDTLTNRSFFGTVGLDHLLPTGTSYSIGWDATRATSNNTFSNFNPSLAQNLSFSLTQPLLRGFRIDGTRAQYLIQQKNQEITDVQLQQQIIATARAVRLAYWTLVGARYNLGVAQASLDISRQTLRDNRTRVEVGTMAPIDVVGAEAEVSRNEEAAIVAAAQIDEAEDALRALLYDPNAPEFWTMDLDLAEAFLLHGGHHVEDLGVILLGRIKVGMAKLRAVDISNGLADPSSYLVIFLELAHLIAVAE